VGLQLGLRSGGVGDGAVPHELADEGGGGTGGGGGGAADGGSGGVVVVELPSDVAPGERLLAQVRATATGPSSAAPHADPPRCRRTRTNERTNE
jgi:hypothetical protein